MNFLDQVLDQIVKRTNDVLWMGNMLDGQHENKILKNHSISKTDKEDHLSAYLNNNSNHKAQV